MQAVTDIKVVFTEINRIKKLGNGWKTNWFFLQSQDKELLASKSLFMRSEAKCIIFGTVKPQINRFYFAATDEAVLTQVLEDTVLPHSGPWVVDLIDKNSELLHFANVFRHHGFLDYAVYQRMTRVVKQWPSSEVNDSSSVSYANHAEAKVIYDILIANFDPICDHLPSLDEVFEAASSQTLLVGKKSTEILGFCLFETTGVTSILRYFWVAEKWRNRRIGSQLMNRYIQENTAARRFILWVNIMNNNAMQKYRHYEYHEDQLSDLILICRRFNDGQTGSVTDRNTTRI